MSTLAIVLEARKRLDDYWASVAEEQRRAHALRQQAVAIETRLSEAGAPLQAELDAANLRASRTLGPWVHAGLGLYASRYIYGRERTWYNSIAWLRRQVVGDVRVPRLQIKVGEHDLTDGTSPAEMLREADDILVRNGWFLIEREEPDLAVAAAHALRLEAAVNRRMGRQHDHYDFQEACPVCAGPVVGCPCEADGRLVVTGEQIQIAFTQALNKRAR